MSSMCAKTSTMRARASRKPKRQVRFAAAPGCTPACHTHVSAMGNVRAYRAVGGLLVFAGCATTPDAGTQFDGTYAGASTLSRGSVAWCGPDGAPDSLTVSAGRFRYSYTFIGPATVVVQLQLHADGSFSGGTEYFESESGLFRGPLAWVTVVGHIAGATLDAQVESLNCGRHASLSRS
jgi:hypothetical protein